MTHVLIFNFVLFSVSLFAFIAGGMPERATAVVFLTAATASFVVLRDHALAFDVKLVWIDIATFASLVAIAVRANRFWPLYISALQLLTVGVHGAKLYDPQLADWMWIGASSKLAYPTLILLTIGIVRHRQRIDVFGSDRDWSPVHREEAYQ